MKKKILIATVLLLAIANVKSQSIQVIYEEQMKSNVQINDPQIAAAMEAQLSSMKKMMCLFYCMGESIYESLSNNTNNDSTSTISQSGMTIVMMSNDISVYKNQKNKELISQEYILDRRFLITDTLSNFEWVLLDEEKVVNNFKCHKATDKTGCTTAWYCLDIPINDGPYIFWGLPGLIIELSHMNKTVTALDVIPISKEDEVSKIKKLTGGKKISRKEFDLTMQKKMKEMGGKQQGVDVKINIQPR
jgi:GLPGLI family protein